MEKRIILNEKETNFWIEDTGRLRNEKTKKYLKGGTNKGYHFYSLYFLGKQYTLYTHRLVAEYFLENPLNLSIVHHKDGNKLNNNINNLEWISTEEHQKTITQPSIKPEIIYWNPKEKEEMKQFRNSPYFATISGKIINTEKNIELRLEKTGEYFRFTGNYNLGKKHYFVHRVVWECFNGEIPKEYEINHIDSNPANNALSNLELVTHKQNCIKANHKGFEVIAEDIVTGQKREFSSLSQAHIFLFGKRYNQAPLKRAIKEHKEYYGYYWYYKD